MTAEIADPIVRRRASTTRRSFPRILKPLAWNRSINNAHFGHDYYNRAGAGAAGRWLLVDDALQQRALFHPNPLKRYSSDIVGRPGLGILLPPHGQKENDGDDDHADPADEQPRAP